MPIEQAPGTGLTPATGDAARIDALLRSEPAPIIQTAIAAFRRDLPALLATDRGGWVGYHGEERIGTGRSQKEVYALCRRRGLPIDELLVCGVEEGVFDPEEEITASWDV